MVRKGIPASQRKELKNIRVTISLKKDIYKLFESIKPEKAIMSVFLSERLENTARKEKKFLVGILNYYDELEKKEEQKHKDKINEIKTNKLKIIEEIRILNKELENEKLKSKAMQEFYYNLNKVEA